MRERGILLSKPMVLAYKEGRKGQTRRIINPQPGNCEQFSSEQMDEAWGAGFIDVKCPHGEVGDRLWFREAYRTLAKWDHLKPSELPPDPTIKYEADEWVNIPTGEEFGRYRHGRFMMRAFARASCSRKCAALHGSKVAAA